ncbi:MAG: 4Fe-4S double cluster binding domain-containing protein [Desulfobacterales bacterium]|jgi:epoxyqueuosine reductase
MTSCSPVVPAWLSAWMQACGVKLWGIADLKDITTPADETGQGYPLAVSWAIAMDPHVMVTIQQGPNRGYADAYARVNARIDEISLSLTAEIRKRGHRAHFLAASERTDIVHIKGDFPHKTAATRAGLGWIGRHCQLITRQFGPWVRLGTVFSDMTLPRGTPVNRHYCGHCTRCVVACPAKALKNAAWYPGLPREAILDAHACDQWKKKHYSQYHKGHNCGICSAVCPYGLKVLKKEAMRWRTRPKTD